MKNWQKLENPPEIKSGQSCKVKLLDINTHEHDGEAERIGSDVFYFAYTKEGELVETPFKFWKHER